MKKIIIGLMLMVSALSAAVPQKLSYQALVKNSSDQLVTSSQVGVRISILEGSTSGTAIYKESFTATTNGDGVFSIEIGDGAPISGSFENISWGNDSYFVQTEIDPAGGSTYSISGVSELLAVPYAIHASQADTALSITELDPLYSKSVAAQVATTDITNWDKAYGWGDHSKAGYRTKPQELTLKGSILTLSDWGSVELRYSSLAYAPKLSTGNWATFVGIGAGDSATIGAVHDNTGIGVNALQQIGNVNSCKPTECYANVAVGNYTLASDVYGSYNTAIGFSALQKNVNATGNTAVGALASQYNKTGINNSAFGYGALAYTTDATSNNTAIGSNSLTKASASNLTAVGAYALRNNTTGIGNVAVGHATLSSNTTGQYNTAIGKDALKASTGSFNTATGGLSMNGSTTGTDNSAYGVETLKNNTSGWANGAFGRNSLQANSTGYGNNAFGVDALFANTTGKYNTALGVNSLKANTTGGYNTAVGTDALKLNTTGLWNTAVGYNAGPSAVGLQNSTAIGTGATTTASNSVVIGNTFVTSIGGYAAWSNLSDGRYKKDVKENVQGLNFILKLRPVTYKWDMDKLGATNEDKAKKVETGFIAQEVEKAAKEANFDFSGVVKPENEESKYRLAYSEFVVPLVKSVQEQQEVITKQQTAIDALLKKVEALEKQLNSTK